MAHLSPGLGRRGRFIEWLAAPLLASLFAGIFAKRAESVRPKHYLELFVSNPIHTTVRLVNAGMVREQGAA